MRTWRRRKESACWRIRGDDANTRRHFNLLAFGGANFQAGVYPDRLPRQQFDIRPVELLEARRLNSEIIDSRVEVWRKVKTIRATKHRSPSFRPFVGDDYFRTCNNGSRRVGDGACQSSER